ncbi:FMN reductase [Streptomyces rhizosphaerihabitans]|uniref:FMN reductase n=1 Tax=Streptomyces rhizosphaerihabitans TaxID=1266770 RepID=UPI0021BEBED8|nr:FMN reductase [Streptomyces rhizosphaerihabitans]MCT9006446.1 FMN reductase [Streptomyces rhizosphaerihabitans]
MKLVVVSAGLSVPSSTRLLADRLAAATAGRAPGTVDLRVVELRDLAVEIAHNFTNGFPGRALSAAIDDVTSADGLIVVTPVFSASYSGLFKSFFDVLDKDALAGKPVLIAATGGTGRHSLVLEHALRPLFAYLRAVVVPTGVYAASEDWGAEGLADRVERAAGELASLMAALSGPSLSDFPASAQAPAATSAPAQAAPEAAVPAQGVSETAVPVQPVARRADGFHVVPFEEQLAALRV